MNFSPVNMTLLALGGILIYAGVKKETPLAALREILSMANGKKSGTGDSSFGKDGGTSGGGGGGGGGGSW